MLQNNNFSPFRKLELSYLHALSFIFILALILFLSTTSAYSAQVTLTWNPNTEPDLAGYKIYSGPSSGNYDSNIDIGNRTSYVLPNVVEGQTYYIALTAYDSANNESSYSSEFVYNVPDTTLPSTPTNLQSSVVSTSQVDLSWNVSSDNIGVTGYRIYRDSTQIGTTSNTTYQDTVLSPSTTYSYTVSAYDAAGNESGQSSASSATTLSLPVNNPPLLSPVGNKSVNEGQALSFTISATDSDGDTLSYTAGNLPSGSSFNVNTKTFAWTPTYSQAGTYSNITFQVSDGNDIDLESITITVGNINRPPVLDPIADITVSEGATVTLSPTATDPDGDVLTYTYSGWMSSASYTTNNDDAGTHTVTVTVSDGKDTDSQVVTITVDDIDTTPPNSSISINNGAESTDSTSVTLSLSSDDNVGVTGYYLSTISTTPLVSNTDWVSVTPTINFSADIPYTLSSGDGTKTVYVWYKDAAGNVSNVYSNSIILISNSNVAPVLDPIADITVNEGDTVTLSPTATDPDGDVLTYTYSGWMSSASYTTNNDDAGTHTVTVTVSDGKDTDSQVVTITVGDINRPPVLDTISDITVNESAAITLSPTATDPDGDVLTYTYSGWMTSSSYTTNYNDSGTHAVTITVSDGSLSDSQVVSVTVNNVNQAPVLDLISDITVNEGAAITLSPTATDPDGDALTYTYSGWMTSSSYTTNYNDSGTHTVTVSVSDETLTDSQVVTVIVLNGNSAPVLDPIADITVDEGAAITLNPTATDPDGDALTYTYSGWMSFASYTTNYSDAGTHTVTVTVSDGSLSDSQVLTITVVDKDKGPLEISNLTAVSGETYEIVENGLQNGALRYIDRSYTFTSIPSSPQGATYIKTANDDKRSSGSTFLSFDVNQDVRVYVAHDNRISKKPSWLQSFVDTGDTIVNSDSTFGVFAKDISAGIITLGGNEGAGNSSMYTVIIVVQGTDVDTIQPSTPANLQAQSSTNKMNLSWNASTDNVGVTGYKIYRDGIQVANISSTTYQDTGLSKNSTYVYTVSAYDAAGNESSQSAPLVSDTKPPGKPSGFKIVST